MSSLVPLVQAAGAAHLIIIAANVFLPRQVRLRESLGRLSPILRQIVLVHWIYILIVLAIFALLCLFFAPALVSGEPLGRTLSACLAGFWGLRVVIQVLYYDREFKRRHALGNIAFIFIFAYLAGLFAAVVFAVPQ